MQNVAEIVVYLNGVALNIDSEDTWTVNPKYSAFGNTAQIVQLVDF